MILVNLSNQIGAGPRNISLNFIRAAGAAPNAGEFLFLTTDDPAVRAAIDGAGVRHAMVPTFQRRIPRIARFLYVQLLLIWFSSRNGCDKILAFGNFLLFGRARRKGVLLHHPYLVDDALLARLPLVPRLLERIKRALFRYTLRRVDVVIVQSEYMRDMFKSSYPRYRRNLRVIPNPVSDNFRNAPQITAAERAAAFASKTRHSLIYASRFYPHKNHAFLLDLAEAFAERGVEAEIVVTLDPEIPGAAGFLASVAARGLAIRNLGEVSQPDLALAYADADAAIFPSRAETFGNPLVEALQFALPVVAPAKGYALSVLGDSGIFFEEDDVQECVDKCFDLLQSPDDYAKACVAAKERGKAFPDSDAWFTRMLGALDD